MASTIRIQDIVNAVRVYPELTPVFGVGGYTQEPALSIANDVIQRMLAQSLPWKFNRAAAPPFLTVALQQDYITNLTDLAWLEQGWRIDINNTSTPQPVFSEETVRDLQQTWMQSSPFQMSWIPNRLAIFGKWQRLASYASGLGATQTPTTPVQQFTDVNGNFLAVTTNGTSGTTQPVLPSSSPVGSTVQDGSVVWSVVNPEGIAFRVAPLPATSGLVWEIHPIYQKKPPTKKLLTDTLDPLPDEFRYLFQQGFLSMCRIHAGTRDAREDYIRWEEMLITALRSADRERDQTGLYPSEGLVGGSSWGYGAPVGPAWPYWIAPY